MIQCPECRSLIPDDSYYCDQCGKELHWCPECKKPKRGTRCPVCDSELILSSEYHSGQVMPPSSPQGTQQPSGQTIMQPAPAQPGSVPAQRPAPQATAVACNVSRLVGNGLALNLMEGTFGRTSGMWPALSAYQYVSGRHGTISHVGNDWAITDLGSTNGTFVNGQRIATGVATLVHRGDCVRIATYDFTVE